VPEVLDFTYESASCHLIIWNEGIRASLGDVCSKKRRCGHATKLLETVMQFVDECGLETLTAACAYPEISDGLSTLQLIEFYGRFGFLVEGDIDPEFQFMRRPAR